MRADLSYYILSPSHLDEVSITELEHSISEQPFNQTLRMLLAKKTFGSAESLLQDAAVTTTERSFLKFMLINESQVRKELQLNDTTSHDIIKTDITVPSIDIPVFNVTEDHSSEYSEVDSEDSIIRSSISDVLEEVNEIIPDSQECDTVKQQTEGTGLSAEPNHKGMNIDDEVSSQGETFISADEIDNLQIVNTQGNAENVKKKKKSKRNKKLFKLDDYSGISDYVSWLCSLSGKDMKSNKKQKKRRKIDETVKRSITKSDSIISEPLADLLASQGHFADAIKMYDQLILKYPEKSVYFAAKIDKILKNNTE
jgi:hypothetical protein